MCKVDKCQECVKASVEYSPHQKYPQTRHILAGTSFWEKQITGKCCGDKCSMHNNPHQGFGECWDSGEEKWCDWTLCMEAKCHCRRLTFEIVPFECHKCIAGWALKDKTCYPCPADHKGLDGVTCTPVNHCAQGTDACDTHAKCTFTGAGTYSCQCNEGYTGTGRICSAVDNCQSGSAAHGCHDDAVCTVTGPGTNTCKCRAGYKGDGWLCSDIDECSDGTHSCTSSQYCTDTQGSFTCQDCHEHCDSGCLGGGPDQCMSCLRYNDGAFCTDDCPAGKYAATDSSCQPCHEQCLGGCSGPGDADCVQCARGRLVTATGWRCVSSCAADTWMDSGLTCRPCSTDPCSLHPLAQYRARNCTLHADSSCETCAPGHRCDDGVHMETCSAGTHQPEYGQSSCEPCPLGHFCPDENTLQFVPLGVGVCSRDSTASWRSVTVPSVSSVQACLALCQQTAGCALLSYCAVDDIRCAATAGQCQLASPTADDSDGVQALVSAACLPLTTDNGRLDGFTSYFYGLGTAGGKGALKCPEQHVAPMVGMHTCTLCPPGQTHNQLRDRCIDLNECAVGRFDCVPPLVCRNSRGGYVCGLPEPDQGGVTVNSSSSARVGPRVSDKQVSRDSPAVAGVVALVLTCLLLLVAVVVGCCLCVKQRKERLRVQDVAPPVGMPLVCPEGQTNAVQTDSRPEGSTQELLDQHTHDV